VKPTSPTTIERLLDDHAALGDSFRIEAMGTRAMRRATRYPHGSLRASTWAHVASACAYRAFAVRARLRGDAGQAMGSEAKSEAALQTLYSMTRGRN
jgi:hypothetical protein